MSTDRLFVKPAPGIKVREPGKPFNHLPAYGKSVPAEQYWHRRLKSKDVVLTTEAEIAEGAELARLELATTPDPASTGDGS